ncbi:MAG: formate/nitrite transporter family protein, partial [Limibacillus sp.]
SSEVLLLLVSSEIGASDYLFMFFLPALLGNVIGGTALFTLLAYGQVKEEL